MLSRVKLATKLVVAIVLLVAISVIIGLTSIVSMDTMKQAEDDIYTVNLMSIVGLSKMLQGQELSIAVTRTLLTRRLFADAAFREKLMNRLEESDKLIEEGYAIYEPLERVSEEEKLWQQASPLWKAWQQDHTNLVNMFKDKEQLVDAGVALTDPRIVKIDNELGRVHTKQ